MMGTATKFKTLVSQIEVLAPMCNFSVSEVQCSERESFFRKQYQRLNKETTDLVNLVIFDGKCDMEAVA
jgi:hypothetical protein